MLVLAWRNSKSIRQWMEYQELITEEQQRIWYANLKDNEHYFEIWYEKEFIGLISLKWMDTFQAFEAGVFIGIEKYYGTGLVFESSVLLLDWAIQNNIKSIFAKVHQNNIDTIAYNEFLAFEKSDSKGDFVIMQWNEEQFQKKFSAFLKED